MKILPPAVVLVILAVVSGAHAAVPAIDEPVVYSASLDLAKKFIVTGTGPMTGPGYGGYILYAHDFPTPTSNPGCKIRREQPESLVMVDQEGGLVVRIKNRVIGAVPMDPRNLETVTPEAYEQHSRGVAEKLKNDFCIDVNLAPVLGPPTDFGQPARTMQTTIDDVFAYGKAFERSMIHGGIIPTLKHFPGAATKSRARWCGDGPYTIKNSECLRVRAELGELYGVAKKFAPSEPSFVMMSNWIYEEYSQKPAIVDDRYISWLRDDFRFTGVVISDALNEIRFSKEVLREAVRNADMLIILDWRLVRQAERWISEWIADGTLSAEEIDRKLSRIARAQQFARR